MFAVKAYIEQEIENPVYSITKWVNSTTVGATFQASVDETRNTPKLILVNTILVSCMANAGTSQLSLTDQVNNVILNVNFQNTTGGLVALNVAYLFKGTMLIITSNAFGGGFTFGGFSVGYQYIING